MLIIIKEILLTITAPNEFARDWLECSLFGINFRNLYELTGEKLAIHFIIPQSQSMKKILKSLLLNKNTQKMSLIDFHRVC